MEGEGRGEEARERLCVFFQFKILSLNFLRVTAASGDFYGSDRISLFREQALTVPMREHPRARYRFYLVYFFSLSFSLFLSPYLVFFLFLTPSSPPLVLIFFQSCLMRRAREIVRNERLFHLDVLAIVLIWRDSGSNPHHYVNIRRAFIRSRLARKWRLHDIREFVPIERVTIYIVGVWFGE